MLFKPFYRLYKDDPEVGGTGADRGDEIPEIDPEDPDDELKAAKAAEKLTKEIEDEDENDEKKPKKDSRIPLSRHKEILERERAQRAELEQRLSQYQNGHQVASLNENITAIENEVMKLEKEYTRELADGELDKAANIMARIRNAERQMSEAKSDMKIQAAEARATERARYNIALERVEGAFPSLNPDHDQFDEAVMSEVVDLKDAYQAKGMTPTQALQKAVKMLVEPRTTKQEVATTSQPRVGEKDVAAERKTEAVRKTADTVARQPPSMSKVGADSDKLGGGKLDARQVMGMSQKEFASLNEETLAQLRGDTI
jgi:hypothetical protein